MPAMNSPTMAPITASPDEIRRPVMMYGSANGNFSFTIRCHQEALYSSNMATRLWSVEVSPAAVLVMIGNSEIRKAITTTAGIPAPNQITISGAIATIGIVWSRTAYGNRLRSMILLCDISRATLIPTTIASPKPISAVRNVEKSAPSRLVRFSNQASTMSVGAGSR